MKASDVENADLGDGAGLQIELHLTVSTGTQTFLGAIHLRRVSKVKADLNKICSYPPVKPRSKTCDHSFFRKDKATQVNFSTDFALETANMSTTVEKSKDKLEGEFQFSLSTPFSLFCNIRKACIADWLFTAQNDGNKYKP